MCKLWLMNFDDLFIFLHLSKVFAVYIPYKQDQTSFMMRYCQLVFIMVRYWYDYSDKLFSTPQFEEMDIIIFGLYYLITVTYIEYQVPGNK